MTTTALILAAGRGTRMKSSLAKVLHPLCGRPMVSWVIAAAREAGCAPAAVVGHQAEAVRAALAPDVRTVLQPVPRGTGDAVRSAAGVLPAEGTLLVLAGDTPLLRPETLRALLAGHASEPGRRCTVLTAVLPDEEVATNAYGRIVRDAGGRVLRIVETANASPAERQIAEVNTGVYAFDARWLFEEVAPALVPHPPKDEYYLTDAVEAAAAVGGLSAVIHGDLDEVTGVNDRAALAHCEGVLRARINRRWMLDGVTLRDPASAYIDAEVRLERDVTVGPGAVLRGHTTVAEGAEIGAYAVVEDCEVGPGARILPGSVCVGAALGAGAAAGPMARLREGAVLGAEAKVGNFVEVKKATLGDGAKASHLSYIGDAEVGPGANIGAGTITCNYDGYAKWRTVIGAGAFIGSNTALVAPITVGAGAIVGAGSALSADVPDNALGVTRAPQRNIDGLAEKLRARYAARAEAKKKNKD
jgi:bifunctional UDP-N-acetylglucosamine pyrophosphorylase/glucosamine-1-phosphate N-acetyltransferase